MLWYDCCSLDLWLFWLVDCWLLVSCWFATLVVGLLVCVALPIGLICMVCLLCVIAGWILILLLGVVGVDFYRFVLRCDWLYWFVFRYFALAVCVCFRRTSSVGFVCGVC